MIKKKMRRRRRRKVEVLVLTLVALALIWEDGYYNGLFVLYILIGYGPPLHHPGAKEAFL